MDFNSIQVIDDVERLLILRKRLNKTQYEFARLLGVSRSYLSQVERSELPFTHNLIFRINHYLKQENMRNEQSLFSPKR